MTYNFHFNIFRILSLAQIFYLKALISQLTFCFKTNLGFSRNHSGRSLVWTDERCEISQCIWSRQWVSLPQNLTRSGEPCRASLHQQTNSKHFEAHLPPSMYIRPVGQFAEIQGANCQCFCFFPPSLPLLDASLPGYKLFLNY